MNRYLILMIRRPDLDPAVEPLHMVFLNGLRELRRVELSGRFSDKSGGACLLHANDMDEATRIAHSDPTQVSGGWNITLHEWLAH